MKRKFFSLRRQMVLVYLLGGAMPMLLIIGILIGTHLLLADGTLVLGKDGSTPPVELAALAKQYAGQAGSFRVDVNGETNLLTVESLSDTAYCNDLILLSLEPSNVILNAIAYTMR